jgi:hypothetical protein
MSEVVTGIAELGQGALTAREVEPSHGAAGVVETGDGHTHESACLNCRTPLTGAYCHACGQHAHIHRTLGAFFHDLAHGVFHVEGKIWRTLPMLAFKPGKLTREYIDGRRASYLSPIALFLFSVFLLFAGIHMLEGSDHAAGSAFTSVDQAATDQQTELANLLRQRAKASDPQDQKELDAEIAEARGTLASLKSIKGLNVSKRVQWTNGGNVHSDIAWLDRGFAAFRKNPDLALYKLQMTAYKYSWLLIPISVPLLWLLFPFSRRFRLYDHTVFVTYSLAFMTLLALVESISAAIGGTFGAAIAGLMWLLAPVHMYCQLRGSYAIGRAAAVWRTAALVAFAVIALTAFAAALLSAELTG